MDDETFDRIARRIEPLTSRRATLGALAGIGLLSALGGAPLDTEAKRKKKKKKCKPEKVEKTCAGRCGLGTVCVEGECEACGFVGAPCCSTGSCNPFIGSGCFGGFCELCGAAGEQCCPGGICNIVGLVCNDDTCQS